MLALGHFDHKLLPVVIKNWGQAHDSSYKKRGLMVVETKFCYDLCFEKRIVCLDYWSSVNAGEFT